MLRAVRRLFPFITTLIGDGGYRGAKLDTALRAIANWHLTIVKRIDAAGFTVLPKRWIVERTFAWFGRCRRLAKDFETLASTAVAFVLLASIRLMLRRLARLGS